MNFCASVLENKSCILLFANGSDCYLSFFHCLFFILCFFLFFFFQLFFFKARSQQSDFKPCLHSNQTSAGWDGNERMRHPDSPINDEGIEPANFIPVDMRQNVLTPQPPALGIVTDPCEPSVAK